MYSILPPNFNQATDNRMCKNCEFFKEGDDSLEWFKFYCNEHSFPIIKEGTCDSYKKKEDNEMANTEELIKLRAEKEKLEKELIKTEKQLNWLAEYAADGNPCPVKPSECPQDGEDICDTNICTQCWREAARKQSERR